MILMVKLRYFVKEELPRIRYANPSLNIVVNKSGDPKAEGKPTMTLEFGTCILYLLRISTGLTPPWQPIHHPKPSH